ncbi:uncharacterized protein LJ264_007740 isoform 1-T1 [Porphyrio hochstetteri]
MEAAVLSLCSSGSGLADKTLVSPTSCCSSLRASKSPDATADITHHQFTYAVMPHWGSFQGAAVIQHAYNLNFLLHVVLASSAQCPAWSFFSVSSPVVMLEALKQLRLPPSQELCEGVVPGKGKVSPLIPIWSPESCAREQCCSSGEKDNYPLPNLRKEGPSECLAS